MAIQVEFTYCIHGQHKWRNLPLTAEQFFDPPEESGEELEYDSVHRYLDLREYLEQKPHDIRAIRVQASDSAGNSLVEKIQYWAEDNQLSETTWTGVRNLQRIIYSVAISETPHLILTATAERHDGMLRVVHETLLAMDGERYIGSRNPWSPKPEDFWSRNPFEGLNVKE